jgi:hypothetical protein
MRDCEYIRHDDKPASRLALKGDDGRFDFYVALNGRLISTILSDRSAISSEGIKYIRAVPGLKMIVARLSPGALYVLGSRFLFDQLGCAKK